MTFLSHTLGSTEMDVSGHRWTCLHMACSARLPFLCVGERNINDLSNWMSQGLPGVLHKV